MNIAFYISGTARRLCEILTDERAERVCEGLKFVFSDERKGEEQIRTLCEEKDIQYVYYDYKKEGAGLSRQDKNRKLSDEILKFLQENQIDYMFLFGHHLLSGQLLVEHKINN